MDRTACADLPAFPLQLLLKRNPDWRAHPAAVVEADKPQAPVLSVNRAARAAGILPGMRYAAALSLAPGLHAGVVGEGEIDEAVAALVERLRAFTPHVEPSRDDPGVFWLDARGLEPLFGSLDLWAVKVHAALTADGFHASLVIGFGRFGSWALARAYRGVHVVGSPEEERTAARAVRLERLALPPAARDGLAKLGVRTVGDLVDLPQDGTGLRYGAEARRLHRMAMGDLAVPLQPARPDPPASRRVILDDPVAATSLVLALVERELPPLLDEVERKGRALAALEIGFRFERLGDHVETVRTAAPTLSAERVLELVRLRLETARVLPDRVAELVLVAEETEPSARQRQLFAEKRRDLEAANRALARVRAQLGNDTVAVARLKDAHLPEERFAWEPLAALGDAKPLPIDEPRLVRRIHAIPLPLPPRPRHEPDGWLLRGLEQGPVVRVNGPYAISSRWWEHAVQRDYHFAETKDGHILWAYYDRAERRWFLQGGVE